MHQLLLTDVNSTPTTTDVNSAPTTAAGVGEGLRCLLEESENALPHHLEKYSSTANAKSDFQYCTN